MPQIYKYLFRQLRGPTLWAMLAMTGVAMLQSLKQGLELIVDQRQSAWVFIKVTALAMPNMLTLIAPLAVFVAGLATFNRLHTEQEIVVCYAGGVSRWQVASPAMRWATWLSLATLAINLWVQPPASREMRAELNAARADLTAALVREGQFTQPAPGLTVYAQTIDRGGLMHNLFIHQEQEGKAATTYTAAEGRLVKRAIGPEIAMHKAAIQTLTKTGELSYATFDDYPFDLSSYQSQPAPDTKAEDRYMSELMHPAITDAWGQKHTKLLQAEFHARIAGPLYNLTFMAFAISAVLGGGFSRLGYRRRIAVMAVIAIVSRLLGFTVEDAAGHTPALNLLQYLIPLGGLAATLVPFVTGGRVTPRRKVAPASAPAPAGAA